MLSLNSSKIGDADETLIIIHGVYGSGDNWASLGREFAKDYQVILLDMRNHGRSPWSDEFDYPSMAKDVVLFAEEHELEKFHILGHSMGGKVAMELAATGTDLLKSLIVVDIAPKSYDIGSHNILLNAMNNLHPETLLSRQELDVKLEKDISEFSVRQFLLKNIKRDENKKFAWKINLKAISENISSIGNYIPSFETPYLGKTLFIRGQNSEYILPSDYSLISNSFPFVSIINIGGAGHWVHADQPKALYQHVYTFLQNQ